MDRRFQTNRRDVCGCARGWSLLELLMALVLLAVLLSFGASSWTPLRQKYLLQAKAQDLLSTLALARAEALKRGVRVTACVSSDGVYCQTNGHWEQGWLLFEDTDGNALRTDAESLIQVHAALPTAMRARGNGTVARYVSYAPNSRTLQVSGAFQSGTITLCTGSNASTQAWNLVINPVGTARLDAVTLASCG
jgi:type IV fimbrial biogenesis protein FimT